MPLVNYSDSEQDDPVQETPPLSKKRKLSQSKDVLPPLPQSFRDLYSSTVRTSTTDDPSLHDGRKRVVPHIQGNWPTHVYLEWCPSPEESDVLSQVIRSQQQTGDRSPTSHATDRTAKYEVRSLLQDDLGVPLPLHVSLSRPLVLKTAQKDAFLDRISQAVSKSSVACFAVLPEELAWHSNEQGTRWFLVLRVSSKDDELLKLLDASNETASAFEQPLLYVADGDGDGDVASARAVLEQKHAAGKFHVSIGWSLSPPQEAKSAASEQETGSLPSNASRALSDAMLNLSIHFTEVKVRIGQDVSSLALGKRRPKARGVFS